jgi:hypothetical protein
MTNEELDVLIRAHLAPFRTKSDFARAFTNAVAALASKGYISTWLPGGSYGCEWRLTPCGLFYLRENSDKHFGDDT